MLYETLYSQTFVHPVDTICGTRHAKFAKNLMSDKIGKRHHGETLDDFCRDDVGHIGVLTALSELEGEWEMGKEMNHLGWRLTTKL